MSEELFNNLKARYARDVDFYSNVASRCEVECRAILRGQGIRGIVSSRAKHIERLLDKVQNRASEKEYSNVDSIYQDIRDLSGVRIALYFPDDAVAIDQLIRQQFNVLE